MKEWIPEIVGLLEDKDASVRATAALTLCGFVPDNSELINELAFSRLIDLLEDKTPVASAAMLALSRFVYTDVSFACAH